jgi:hypothetical protein
MKQEGGVLVQSQVVWHARSILYTLNIGRLLIILAVGVGLGWVWFSGRKRSDDGGTRLDTSFYLRLLAGFLELCALFVFAPFDEHFLFVAKARPLWGGWVAVVLVSAVVLISWAVLWAVLEHFKHSSQKLDILDASESMAKAAATSSHVENLQTNAAGAWIGAFSVAVVWLVAISLG